ncbi:MAG: hypothetical protein EOP19_27765 [Hyphomicrobiales bacterium]|nr:MAG: hypothetical protein EOP19_27765 [Hyphomicrobiales bacterium]
MARSRNWTDSLDLEELSRQLSSLRHDVAGVSRAMTRYGSHTAHDVGDQLWHQGEVVARQLGRQAVKAGKAVREDPVPAIVAVAGFALFLNLILGRKRS